MNAPPSKDRWWLDFIRYGGATWVYALPLVVGFLAVPVLLSFSGRQRGWGDAVILYCAQDQVFAEPLIAAFTRETGIRVKTVFDSEAVKTVGLANRLLAERSHPVCDVFWGNEEFRTRQLAVAGVFVPVEGWAVFGHRSRQMVLATNAAVRVGALGREVPFPPRSMVDLTNAAYRGRVSLAFPLFGTTATHLLVLRQQWGESNWVTWCRALAANVPFLEEGNSQVAKRVARGEAWVGLTDSDDIIAAQREGMPVVALDLGAEALRIPNTVALVAKPGETRVGVRRLYEYLQSDAVRSALVEAGALEAGAMASTALPPDWDRLLPQLDKATGQLKEIFRR